MKGIILAAGSGTRLYPLTLAVNKHLLPVYDKPMIYYPLSVLLLAGIRQVLVITTAAALASFRDLLGDGGQFGVRLHYAVQDAPRGIADAFRVGAEFIGSDPCCLILGDNLFHGGDEFERQLTEAAAVETGAVIFAYPAADPRPFGVVEFDAEGRALSLEEKPARPRSNFVVPGLYFYDRRAAEIACKLRPSARGELEITDLNRAYLQQGALTVRQLPPECLWFDAGSVEALLAAATAIRNRQRAAGRLIGCPEEAAYCRGLIDAAGLEAAAQPLRATAYGQYLSCMYKKDARREGKTKVAHHEDTRL